MSETWKYSICTFGASPQCSYTSQRTFNLIHSQKCKRYQSIAFANSASFLIAHATSSAYLSSKVVRDPKVYDLVSLGFFKWACIFQLLFIAIDFQMLSECLKLIFTYVFFCYGHIDFSDNLFAYIFKSCYTAQSVIFTHVFFFFSLAIIILRRFTCIEF